MAIYKSDEKTKDGRCWYFRDYKTTNTGQRKQYTSPRYLTKEEAKQEEALFLLKRDMPSSKPFELVANDFFEYLSTVRKESTLYTYKKDYNKHIKGYFKGFNINSIKIYDINNWKLELTKNGLKTSYLNKIYNVLKEIFDFAIKNYGIANNPVQLSGRFQSKNEEVIKDEDKIRYINLDEFNKFISVIDDTTWKTFFMFLYYTGMRKGEVQALTWNDIINNEIIVNKTLSVKTYDKYKITSTKNNLNRKIRISKVLMNQLNIYHNEMKKYNDYSDDWFIFGNSCFLQQSTIDRYKHKYFELSGVREITIHEFRHSHVSLLANEYLKSGQTDTTKFFLMMSNRLGHSVEVMKNTYLHLFPTIQDEIVDLLDNL